MVKNRIRFNLILPNRRESITKLYNTNNKIESVQKQSL